MKTMQDNRPPSLTYLANFIFWSRWLQAPLYVGLVAAQTIYVYVFWTELLHLIQAAMGNKARTRHPDRVRRLQQRGGRPSSTRPF